MMGLTGTTNDTTTPRHCITMGAAAAIAARGTTGPRADKGRKHHPPPWVIHPCHGACAPTGATPLPRPAPAVHGGA